MEMAWRAFDGSDNHAKELYFRSSPVEHWQHYTKSPHNQPDLTLPGASKGFTTMQKLLKLGYKFVPSNEAG